MLREYITRWGEAGGSTSHGVILSKPIALLLLLALLLALPQNRETAPKIRKHGDVCRSDIECQKRDSNLLCLIVVEGILKRCGCPKPLYWSGSECVASKSNQEKDKEQNGAALLVVILVPILGGAVVIVCVSIMCCYWLQLMAKDVNEQNKSSEFDEDFYGKRNGYAVSEDDEDSEWETDNSDNEIPMTNLNKDAPPELKVNGAVAETSFTEKNGSASFVIANGNVSSSPNKPVLDIRTENREVGYQASMRQFLAMPSLEEQTKVNQNRPMSAHFISNTRPGTAVRDSNVLLRPKERPKSAAGRPMGIAGPYVSDASKLRTYSPLGPRPISFLSKQEDLGELYDKIAAVADEENKKNEEAHVIAREKLGQDQGSLKQESGGSGQMVQNAVKAFKRKRNMKKVKDEQRRKRKGKKFESLVDQIMRIRLEEEQKPKPILRRQQIRANRGQSDSRRGSRSSEGSRGSSQGGSDRLASGRPESVAQRVLRERQQLNLSKSAVTAKPKPPPIATRRRKEREEAAAAARPLYLALRQNAGRRGSKSQLTERIKQQVHLNAVKHFHQFSTPSALAANIEIVSKKETAPIKSILKKDGGDSRTKKAGRVNIAFEGDSAKDTDDGKVEKKKHSVKVQIH